MPRQLLPTALAARHPSPAPCWPPHARTLTSRHLIWISMAWRCPVGGTRGWCSIAVACSSMNRLPFSPADSSMHDWPMATPTPTVCTCSHKKGRHRMVDRR
jgi:hypothetical protein